MRLFTATLATETNTFSPLPTSLENYRESVFLRPGEHPADAPRMCTAPLFAVADTPENIAECFDVVDDLTRGHGLVTSEMVPALVSVHGDDRRGGTGMARYRY